MLGAGFSLLKLMHHFLGEHELDAKGASELLSRTVWALRSMSVMENDLAERLSEVLAQVWKSGRVRAEPNRNNIGEGAADDSLQLKVKCRMSMSVVFDSVWQWRQNFHFRGGRPADVREQNPQLQQPDNKLGLPASNTDSVSAINEPMLSGSAIPRTADTLTMEYGQPDYDVFDPLNWILDGIVDFPYNFNSLRGDELTDLDALGGGI
jgi:hypothetical protein